MQIESIHTDRLPYSHAHYGLSKENAHNGLSTALIIIQTQSPRLQNYLHCPVYIHAPHIT